MSGKKKATVWFSKGDVNGTKIAKNVNYRESSVMCPKGKKERRGF